MFNLKDLRLRGKAVDSISMVGPERSELNKLKDKSSMLGNFLAMSGTHSFTSCARKSKCRRRKHCCFDSMSAIEAKLPGRANSVLIQLEAHVGSEFPIVERFGAAAINVGARPGLQQVSIGRGPAIAAGVAQTCN